MAQPPYSTADELDFIAYLERRHQTEALQNYARIVCGDLRKWDAGVDVPRVKARLESYLSERRM